jgi:hypothetical protein
MGTKNNPGDFDCYANAEPDEPMFILLGRDPFAPKLVDLWASSRAIDGEDRTKVDEAFACASAMRDWLRKLGKEEKRTLRDKIDDAYDEVQKLMYEVVDAAVEWHKGGGDNWEAEAERLEKAIEALLELREPPEAETVGA